MTIRSVSATSLVVSVLKSKSYILKLSLFNIITTPILLQIYFIFLSFFLLFFGNTNSSRSSWISNCFFFFLFQVIYLQAFVFVILMGKLLRKIFFGQLRAAEAHLDPWGGEALQVLALLLCLPLQEQPAGTHAQALVPQGGCWCVVVCVLDPFVCHPPPVFFGLDCARCNFVMV